ncbi:MAG: class I SAM-dependent methyltransferase [Minisyncoccota bacterium]
MTILITKKKDDYELLDSGDGEKLERFGSVVLARPDPEVLWDKKNVEIWDKIDAHFIQGDRGAKWQTKKILPTKWEINIGDISLLLKIGNNKHIGFFPEQIAQWEWMVGKIINQKSKWKMEGKEREVNVLNLFGYTGGATCVLAKAGAKVTHVDSSKASITWAHENKKLSGLKDGDVRFMLDDARKFVEREIKRGVVYDAILMDPPVYGKGTNKKNKGQMWHIDEDFLPLLERSMKLLSKDPLFVVVTGYASEYSHLSYKNALSGVLPKAQIESGELAIQESNTDRLLPAGIFVRAVFN